MSILSSIDQSLNSGDIEILKHRFRDAFARKMLIDNSVQPELIKSSRYAVSNYTENTINNIYTNTLKSEFNFTDEEVDAFLHKSQCCKYITCGCCKIVFNSSFTNWLKDEMHKKYVVEEKAETVTTNWSFSWEPVEDLFEQLNQFGKRTDF